VVVGQAPRDEIHDSTMIYDIQEGTWTAGTPRPHIGHHHAAEVIRNELYLFGGLGEGENTMQIATLAETTNGPDVSWRSGPDLPEASGSASTALIDSKARL
jgi:hypothetical protein